MSFKDLVDDAKDAINNLVGETYTYTRLSGGSTIQVSGVFRSAFVESSDVQSKHPILRNVQLSLLPGDPVEGDTVEIESEIYKIVGHEPDSHGYTILILQKN